MARRTVKLLTPCTARGVAFEQRPEGRFCPSCGETVHDLSRATRREAVALLESHGGRLCGRVRRSTDGSIRFRPEPPERGSLGSAIRTAAVALSLAACGSDGTSEPLPITPEAPTAPEPDPEPPAAPEPPVVTAPPEPVPAEPEEPDEHVEDVGSHDSAHHDHHRVHRQRHPPVDTNLEDMLDGGLGLVDI